MWRNTKLFSEFGIDEAGCERVVGSRQAGKGAAHGIMRVHALKPNNEVICLN